MRTFQKNIRDVRAWSRKVAAMNWTKTGNDERKERLLDAGAVGGSGDVVWRGEGVDVSHASATSSDVVPAKAGIHTA
jgi:hypothetical protein